MTKIKFCGLTRPVDAKQAATLGAAYVGVVFAPGPRQVEPAHAREIFESAPDQHRVGVFRHIETSSLLRAAREADLDVLQLHGHFRPDDLTRIREEFEGELWPVVSIEHGTGNIGSEWKGMVDVADALLLDASVRGVSGGTGRVFDWHAVARVIGELRREIRIVLAGGLTPANVGEGIAAIRPAIVDVSSGIETAPGIKDPSLMTSFAQAVRSASIV